LPQSCRFRTSQGKVLWEYLASCLARDLRCGLRVRPANPSMIDMPGMGQPIAQDWSSSSDLKGLVVFSFANTSLTDSGYRADVASASRRQITARRLEKSISSAHHAENVLS